MKGKVKRAGESKDKREGVVKEYRYIALPYKIAFSIFHELTALQCSIHHIHAYL